MTRAAGVLVALALTVLAGCGGDPGAPAASSGVAVRATGPPAGWTVVSDAARGFRVAFPSSWRRSARSLTPHLSDPRELLSVGTGPLIVIEGRCAQMPTGALSRLGAEDVLVSVQERRDPGRGYPRRPARFRLGLANRSEAIACLSDPDKLDTWWMSFRDGDRAFYALVALGRPTSTVRRRQAERVLDSLRFTPRAPRGAG